MVMKMKGDKRKELELLLKKRKGDDLFLSLSSIILKGLPNRFWKDFSAGELFSDLEDYISFILGGSPYIEKKGKRLQSPKVRVYNPAREKGETRSLKRDTTVVEIHLKNLPFIYESIRNYFTKKGYRIIGAVHPSFTALREGGTLAEVSPPGKGDEELFINLYIEKIAEEERLKDIENDLQAILRCLIFSVGDFLEMKERLEGLAAEVEAGGGSEGEYSGGETADFLRWLADNNFVLIGMREYSLVEKRGITGLAPEKERDLGIFRDDKLPNKVIPGLLPEIEEVLVFKEGTPHRVTSDFCNNGSSIIYQLPPAEFFSIRTLDRQNGTPKETLILGRLTRGSSQGRGDIIPILRQKASSVMDGIEQGPSSFEYREARALFNFIPKEELFYSRTEQLEETIANIMSIQSDDEVSFHIRKGDWGRYAMVMVTISRKDDSFAVRIAIENYLTELFKRHIAARHHSSTESRALLFYYFVLPGREFDDVNRLRIEEDIGKRAIGWDHRFYLALYDLLENKAQRIYSRYIGATGNLYRDATSPEAAVNDIIMLEELFRGGRLQAGLTVEGEGKAALKLYSLEKIPLMKMLKTLANFGLYVTSEQAFHFEGVKGGGDAHIFSYGIEDTPERLEKLGSLLPLLLDAMVAMEEGRCEDDSLNRLVLLEGMKWRELELVRTLKNYLLQINRSYHASSLIETLVRHSETVRRIYSYFEVKFEPFDDASKKRRARMEKIGREIEDKLGDIQNLGEFQVMNSLFEIVKSTNRTNLFLKPERDCISIKIDCTKVTLAPSPKPTAEIYIHSPAFEGVHLRGGLVARGGIRWSDRTDDFRTEILGLMKTQMLKNSIIVPVGAKGGFIIKREDFPSKEERYGYMKEKYRSYIGGLLDLTDNYLKNRKVHPKELVIYDDFDPYFVVAADKGTAALSDTANEISREYNFWLGDAFASGGASGYDHKKIGITARGAWECVKRHFRETGTDIQKESITVVGIGDMSGDVFGNGMLLSRKIKLVGAFNHLYIFLDPDPDPEVSFKERKRLFNLPGSSWTDYRSDLISRGGGVYLRSAKSVPVSEEMRRRLGTNRKEVDGEEMIRLLLRADVDLLYNGGIGTYIKAGSESDIDVGDKANDRVRVNACQVRARVIGEGGNLGITQLGRLEYAAGGGGCNTDAVDNSGGVDISDHEVNIKIMLNHLVEKGEIKSVEERDSLLLEMTDQVTEKVLKNNYLQSAAISMDLMRSKESPETFIAVIDEMERSLDLSRAENFIPPSQDMSDAVERGEGVITRPMLAVLIGHQKMKYYTGILESPLVDTLFTQKYLNEYFPDKIGKTYEHLLEDHRLKREIISTVIINRIINQAGITLFPSMTAATGKSIPEIAKAYIIIEELLNARQFRREVFDLDNIVSADVQYRYLTEMEETIAYALRWFITHRTEERITFDFVLHYARIVQSMQEGLWESIDEICREERRAELRKRVKNDTSMNVPEDLAKRFATLSYVKDLMDIIRIKEEHHYNFHETARLYIKVMDYFQIDWLGEMLSALKTSDRWGRENIANLRHELRDHQNGIVGSVLNFKRKGEDLLKAFDNYLQEKADEAAKYGESIESLKEEGKASVISMNVMVKRLSAFISRDGQEEI